MNAVGLIVEYNPFHNGHLHHLQQSKQIAQRDAVVAVMSGNFLQRGEPALLDKWTRTKMALQGGCDLVIELPVAYATSSAEWFAHGSIALLQATGVVDSFCFGTESGQLTPLLQAAKLVSEESPQFKQQLESYLNLGLSYPQAYSSALTQLYDQSSAEDHLNKEERFRFDLPNHTLGLHYLIARQRIGSAMTPYTITREKAQYNDELPTDLAIASATAIRKLLLEHSSLDVIKSYVPSSTYQLLIAQQQQGITPMHWENFATPLFHTLAVSSSENLATYREIEEGLQHRIKYCLRSLPQYTLDQLLLQLKTKRYTKTKLQRALLAILLQHQKHHFQREQLANGIQYIRVLGFTERGQALLKQMKKTATLPIIHTPAAIAKPSTYLELDIAATAAYMLARSPEHPELSLLDYTQSPIRI
ncbi:MAG: nucleotidyltransferase [Candidatus Pristimantibacillus lignocellulolyticus]|uniref:tRNA(Met) cytidine acetate ligase n=1 Tax=Candidatus Pristimantibacillus lignocellulolyticus TaxID=2994561 RepID=A0A9J6ZB17_9BACL|nr:MAG: nucleotidyltransferase [Candidatus Pristimantibacillus lignocellulolyticus]